MKEIRQCLSTEHHQTLPKLEYLMILSGLYFFLTNLSWIHTIYSFLLLTVIWQFISVFLNLFFIKEKIFSKILNPRNEAPLEATSSSLRLCDLYFCPCCDFDSFLFS